ncbi:MULTISPECIES: MerR family transcriptional regulator [unclassified Bradyrhizobium]|uniref:MerR family transcriptional regulator n=1 Tax=unclassified Bradyrhizobium TaxID=2631580 RepID=UPI0028E46329|nr:MULTISPECIES: MerR family transcriptional regulator [unclassified Bradyrhizobium]
MKIGQLASRADVSERMLRYYESEGLLRPGRTAAGYRDYSENDVSKVRRIVVLNGAGFKLKTIGQLLPCALPEEGREPCQALKDSIAEKIGELDRQIVELSESRKLLASMIAPRQRSVTDLT